MFNLLAGQTADIGINRIHANVHQLVQVTEDSQLWELRYTGDKHKTQIAVGIFQYGIEAGQHFTVNVL